MGEGRREPCVFGICIGLQKDWQSNESPPPSGHMREAVNTSFQTDLGHSLANFEDWTKESLSLISPNHLIRTKIPGKENHFTKHSHSQQMPCQCA